MDLTCNHIHVLKMFAGKFKSLCGLLVGIVISTTCSYAIEVCQENQHNYEYCGNGYFCCGTNCCSCCDGDDSSTSRSLAPVSIVGIVLSVGSSIAVAVVAFIVYKKKIAGNVRNVQPARQGFAGGVTSVGSDY